MSQDDRFSDSATSLDTIFNGAVKVRQHKSGYRFSIDALLLAWYVSRLSGNRAVELCAGSCVVSLALNHHRTMDEIHAIELQPALADLAVENCELNSVDSISVLQGDFRNANELITTTPVDFVYANPPFREAGRGRLNPDPEKAIARHELNGTLRELLHVSERLISDAGRVALVLLHERYEQLLRIAEELKMSVLQVTWIHPFQDRDANLFLVLLGKEEIESTTKHISIWKEQNVYTDTLKAILSGDWTGEHPLEDSY